MAKKLKKSDKTDASDRNLNRLRNNAKHVRGDEKRAKGKKGKAKVADRIEDSDRVTFREALKAGPGFDPSGFDNRATPAFDGNKADAEDLMPQLAARASDLQERLYAASTGGSKRRVLLVIQGMDTSGKGGIMRHVVGAMDPQGSKITAFKKPTEEELSHHFLWRIDRALPEAGIIGVFDRSQYEDVLVVRVHDLVPPEEWGRRYDEINNWEQRLVDDEMTIIKVWLNISSDEQKDRLARRLDRPDKFWKFNPGDIEERRHWDDYMDAYQAVIERTSTDAAPWYVIPADRKWYARLAVMNLLLEHLTELDPQWPEADFDVEEQKELLAET